MSDTKRKQILEVSKDLFAKYGYKKTTLEDIGNAIGLNKASLYHYYKNKEEIFISVAMDEFEQFMLKLHTKVDQERSCELKLKTYFSQYLLFWTRESMVLSHLADLNPETIQGFMNFGKDIYETIERGENDFLANILQNCIDNNEIRNCDVYQISNYLFALIDGLKEKYTRMKRSDSTQSIDVLLDDANNALTILIAGLRERTVSEGE